MLIKEITIKNTSKGFENYEKVSIESLELKDEGIIKHNYYNHFGNSIVKTSTYNIKSKDMKEFFKDVSEKVKINDWKDDYTSSIKCGHEWLCNIKYEDNSVKEVKWNIEYPPKAKEFIKGVLSLTKYKDDPWIF